MAAENNIAKYESHIARIEQELADARETIEQQRLHNGELAEAIESTQSVQTYREIGALNAAFQYIEMCQRSLDGQHICGEDGCTTERRELKPEEGAAFSAACDMLSRMFDGEFQFERGVSPEAGETE